MPEPLTVAHIDVDAIRGNVAHLKSRLVPKTLFMAVVKADGYGHGAVQSARAAVAGGADWLGVARLAEAVALRDAGFRLPILVFGYLFPEDAVLASDLDLTATVYNEKMAREFSLALAPHKKRLRIHIKADTGMGRVGLTAWDNPGCAREILAIHRLPHLLVTGLYTHFSSADTPEDGYTRLQIQRFSDLIHSIRASGADPGICHAANSAGLIHFPASHFDMVRAGIAVYGLYPDNCERAESISLGPAMALKSVITMVKPVPKDFHVSYGRTYTTPAPTRLAAVAIGYADGYSRAFSSCGRMLVNGEEVKVAGRVCMDQTLVDVGHIPSVQAGDEVVVVGRQKGKKLSAETQARSIGTINYEVVSGLTARVERVYC